MRDRMSGHGTYVALLRGINVGGKNKLPMQSLAEIFTSVGCGAVQTYVQSGNVVFQAGHTLARRIPDLIAEEISRRLGLQVPVVVRNAAELYAVVLENPFLHAGADPATLHVAFLAAVPDPARLTSLEPERSPPDEFLVQGRDIYLRLPNGVARTRFTNAYFDARLATTCTLRNWNTVRKLVELSGGRA